MTTFIDTAAQPRAKVSGGQGEVAEIVNQALCGAVDVKGMLRWLKQGERFDAQALRDTHQLIYLMEGDGVIKLENKDHKVAKGAGVYLGPNENASISQSGSGTLKLLHLVVPNKRG
jgi:quercetin dioxygenase-like cupin family protein